MTPEIAEKLLDWPVLTFVLVIILVIIFREHVHHVLRRGEITIGWGEKSLKIQQLSEGLDQELDPIRDDIANLQAAVAILEKASGNSSVPPVRPAETKELNDGQADVAHGKMLKALESGRYTWRSIERLATIGGISPSQAYDLLDGDTRVSVGRGKSGRQIARLRSRLPQS